MKTFNEHILESQKLDPVKEELHGFLRREKIIGFNDEILSILHSSPLESVIDDIKDSFKEEANINVTSREIRTMDIKSMLDRYLNWNGIPGYTEAIVNILGKTKSELYKGRELLNWRDKYYYYRPENGSSTIWAWDNPETEGIPKLIKTQEIYKTPTYYNKEYFKDIEKVYKKS